MTASAMTGDRDRVLEAGMDDHIAKPLSVTGMLETMARWIRPARQEGPASHPESTGARAAMQLPGIDVGVGLATTMNHVGFYHRQLAMFRDSQGLFGEAFRSALDGSDPEAPARMAHTLKGSAGSIGARGVQAAAEDLERACLEGAPQARLQSLSDRVVAELEPVLRGLRQAELQEAAPVPGRPRFDPTRFEEGLELLRNLLRQSDTRAGDLVEDLLPLAQGRPIAAELARAAELIAAYDYPAALSRLDGSDQIG